MKKTTMRGLTDKRLITILRSHEQAINSLAVLVKAQAEVIEGLDKGLAWCAQHLMSPDFTEAPPEAPAEGQAPVVAEP